MQLTQFIQENLIFSGLPWPKISIRAVNHACILASVRRQKNYLTLIVCRKLVLSKIHDQRTV